MELTKHQFQRRTNMLYQDYTAKLLEMEDVIVDDVRHTETIVEIALHQKPRNCSCPACGSTERTIHDYRIQRIRDVPIIGKQTTLILRKRRYKCKQCGKRFIEPVDFLPRYRRITNRVFGVIADKLAGVCSFTDVAKEIGISVSTVIRLFDLVQYPKPDVLPQTIAIDEFKGNTGSEKYQCIITDVENNIVLDILPNRYEEALAQYLRSCDRSGVRIFVSDIWHPFTRVSGALFPHAIQLVDKYPAYTQAI